MPTYDYRCETNGKTLEVKHSMRETVATWGELCAKLGIDTGETPAEAPVQRLATGGNVVKSGALANPQPAPCGKMGGCGGGMCGLN